MASSKPPSPPAIMSPPPTATTTTTTTTRKQRRKMTGLFSSALFVLVVMVSVSAIVHEQVEFHKYILTSVTPSSLLDYSSIKALLPAHEQPPPSSKLLPDILRRLKEQGGVTPLPPPLLNNNNSANITTTPQRQKLPSFPLPNATTSATGSSNGSGTTVCSCANPDANRRCCRGRNLFVLHKMGAILTRDDPHLRPYYQNQRISLSTRRMVTRATKTTIARIGFNITNDEHYPTGEGDYRDVFMFRDLYDSLASGYLYHKNGNECWKDIHGGRFVGGNRFVKNWTDYLSYDLQVPSGVCLCRYLETSSIEDGMRALIDFAFHYWYPEYLARYAMSLQSPQRRERTKFICFEDMAAPSRRDSTRMEILTFLFNGLPTANVTTGARGGYLHRLEERHRARLLPPRLPRRRQLRGIATATRKEYGHATSHNPKLRALLLQAVKEVDDKYYCGDIAWLASIWPC